MWLLKVAENFCLRTADLFPGNLKIVEVCDAVGFGPQPDLPRLRKRGIFGLEDLPVIKVNFKARFLEKNG